MEMNSWFLVAAVAFPLAAGVVLLLVRPKKAGMPAVWCLGVSVVTAVLVWMLVLNPPEESVKIINFTKNLRISFRLDGAGRVFAAIVGTLWPLAALYAGEYMEGDARRRSFFAFYTLCLGVTLGVCFAENLLTMYLFYELLTLFTIPLVIHPLTKRAVHAARKYMYFSFGGTAFAFISLIFLTSYGGDVFTAGGIIGETGNSAVLIFVWFLGFMGFGVKAALFPFYSWLPDASVAPTPVTALLHAVAVVKSGVFAIIRLTYYCFGTDFVKGTWAHWAALGVVIFTMVFGSVLAVREPHFKRRLAYSTVANLSYILVGVMMLTPAGLEAGFIHMLSHALMKICVFFCAGAVLHKTGLEYVWELSGVGKSMPVTMACFTVCSAALTGLPPFFGFVSKYSLITACINEGSAGGFIGAAALVLCGLLTAVYMFTVVIRAYFPKRDGELLCAGAGDAGWRMTVPIVLIAAAVILFGIWTGPVFSLVGEAVAGAF